MLTADLILLKIENRYFKNPFEIPEGAHGEMAFWASLQIAIMTEQLYWIIFMERALKCISNKTITLPWCYIY